MNVPSATAAAHNPTVVCVPREVAEARRRIEAVVELCLDQMTHDPDGALTDCDTVWPSDVLSALGIEHGPGSELASRPEEE
jgi:hypothetical protein